MKRHVALLLFACVALIVGCGSDDGDSTSPETAASGPQASKREPKATSESTPKPTQSAGAAIAIVEQEATSAAADLGTVDESELLPSEDGAELLFERGYINEKRFCAADDAAAYEAELGPEVEAAFESGWASSAPTELRDLAGALYNALSIGCFT